MHDALMQVCILQGLLGDDNMVEACCTASPLMLVSLGALLCDWPLQDQSCGSAPPLYAHKLNTYVHGAQLKPLLNAAVLLCRRTSGQSTQRSKAQPEPGPSKRSSSAAAPAASKPPGSAAQEARAASPQPGDLGEGGVPQAEAAAGGKDVVVEPAAEQLDTTTRDQTTAAQNPAEPRYAIIAAHA